MAERVREAVEGPWADAETCNDVRDGLVAAVEALRKAPPSPFDERESGAVREALSELQSRAQEEFRELHCDTFSGASPTAYLGRLADRVTQSRKTTRDEAGEFLNKWREVDMAPRWTYQEIADLVLERSPPNPNRARPGGCRLLYEWLGNDLHGDFRKVLSAFELLPVQQRGSTRTVRNATDAVMEGVLDDLEEAGCLTHDPDFAVDDIRELYEDVAFAITRERPEELEEATDRFRRLMQNLMTPPPDRVGKQMVVPGRAASPEPEDVREARVEQDVPGAVLRERNVEFVVAEDADRLVTGAGVILVTQDESLIRRRGRRTGHTGSLPETIPDRAKEIVRRFVDIPRVVASSPDFPVEMATFYPTEGGDRLHSLSFNAGVPLTEAGVEALQN